MNRHGPVEVQRTKHGIPVRNIWHMLMYIWDEPLNREKWRSSVERSPTLDALLTNVLIQQMEQRLRIGLGREYIPVNRRIRGIKGRIEFSRSLVYRTFERGEAFCNFTEYLADAPRNQIVRSVLARMLRVGDFGANIESANDLRQRIRKVLLHLNEVSDIQVTVEFIRRQQLGRNDADYGLMFSICEFVLENMMPTEAQGDESSLRLQRQELTLYSVFERFVASFYKHHLPNWQVWPQRTIHWPAAEYSPRLPVMRPDLILQPPGSGRRIVLDTKFTARSLVGYGSGEAERYHSGHLYQIYAYLRTQREIPGHDDAIGILLYPTVKGHISDVHEIQGHELRIETVNLAAEWDVVESELLALMAAANGSCLDSTDAPSGVYGG